MPQQRGQPPPPGFGYDQPWGQQLPPLQGTPIPEVAAPQPPPSTDMRSASQVAFDQIAQIPKGLMGMAASLSPVRFREGWTSPNLEVPEAVRGAASLVGHGITGNAMGMMQDLAPMVQPFTTTARGIGALAAPESVAAPSQPEFEQATQGMTQQAAGLMVPKIPSVGRGIQAAATRAGVPQALVRAGTVVDEAPTAMLPKWMRHPQVVAGPALRGTGRALFNPEALPHGGTGYTPTIRPGVNAEYIPPNAMAYGPSPESIDVPYRPAPGPPAPPPQQLGPYTQPKIGGTAPPQGQLPSPDPTQPLFYGKEGGLGQPPIADVVAQHPKPVVPPKGGPARPETPLQMRERLINFGRGVTKQPTAEAMPFKSPAEIMLPSGKSYMPSSVDLNRGFVIYQGPKGQWTRFDLPGASKPVAAPKPPPTPTRRASDRVTELMKEEAQATTPATGESVMKGGGLNKPSQAIQKARDEVEAEYLKSQLVDRRAPAPPKKPPKK